MVCGKGLKSLKRHLSTAHDMTPAKYCEMFGIPADTPLDAKAYSQA
jgi:predicted transcriptional regulator